VVRDPEEIRRIRAIGHSRRPGRGVDLSVGKTALQATGLAISAGRKRNRYHPLWSEAR